MEYHGLIRRLRGAEKRPGQRITLHFHRDELPSLLRSLETMRQAAQRGYRMPRQLYQDVQSLHETLGAMNREIESLQAQLAEAKRQRTLPLPPALSVVPKAPPNVPAPAGPIRGMDAWQARALEAAEQRRAMRGRC